METKKYGKNSNHLVGKHAHPVKCTDNKGNVFSFKTLRNAAEWLVETGKAKTRNSAQVAITHAVNGKQHFWGKDWTCNSAYGFKWTNA